MDNREVAVRTLQADIWRDRVPVQVPSISRGEDVAWKPDRFTPADRQAVADCMHEIALAKTGKGELKVGRSLHFEADRFKDCGCQFLKLHCDGHDIDFYLPVTCKSRVCPECGRRLYGRVVNRLREVIGRVTARRQKGYFLTLVTLTFNKNRFPDRMPDRSDIVRAYRESSAFLRLFYGKYKCRLTAAGKVVPVYRKEKDANGRRLRKWRGGGFMAVMEVGHDNNNLHVHAVCYGHYESYIGMAAAWAKITGDSINPDFEVTGDPKRAANYVLKYVTKPPQTDSYHRLAEYAGMVKGTRRLRTGGIFYNALTLKQENAELRSCPFCGDKLKFSGYLHESETSDKTRQAMLLPLASMVRDRGTCLPEWSVLYLRAITGDLRKPLQ